MKGLSHLISVSKCSAKIISYHLSIGIKAWIYLISSQSRHMVLILSHIISFSKDALVLSPDIGISLKRILSQNLSLSYFISWDESWDRMRETYLEREWERHILRENERQIFWERRRETYFEREWDRHILKEEYIKTHRLVLSEPFSGPKIFW